MLFELLFTGLVLTMLFQNLQKLIADKQNFQFEESPQKLEWEQKVSFSSTILLLLLLLSLTNAELCVQNTELSASLIVKFFYFGNSRECMVYHAWSIVQIVSRNPRQHFIGVPPNGMWNKSNWDYLSMPESTLIAWLGSKNQLPAYSTEGSTAIAGEGFIKDVVSHKLSFYNLEESRWKSIC